MITFASNVEYEMHIIKMKYFTILKRRFVFLTVMFSIFFLQRPYAQESNKESAPQTKQQKKAEKRKEEQLRKSHQSEAEGKKRQLEIQTKEVRKRMKQSRKEAERINKNKRKPFWERFYIRKKVKK